MNLLWKRNVRDLDPDRIQSVYMRALVEDQLYETSIAKAVLIQMYPSATFLLLTHTQQTWHMWVLDKVGQLGTSPLILYNSFR